MSQDIIKPTVGRKVWFHPNGSTQLEKPEASEYTVDFTFSNGDQPFDATVIYVWNDRMVNLLVTDHRGRQFAATSVTLVQPDVLPPAVGHYAIWMPYQVATAKKPDPAADSHASAVLYPAIWEAMQILGEIPEGFSHEVNRAFNVLHDAYWSEVPAPADVAQKRTNLGVLG